MGISKGSLAPAHPAPAPAARRALLLLAAAAIALAAALCLPAAAHAATYSISAGDESALKTAGKSSSDTYNVTLTSDITLTDYWGIKGSVTIDLNGHAIDRNLSATSYQRWGCVIYLYRDAHITINDSAGGGTITGGYSSNSAGGIHAAKGSRIYLYGGSICNNSSRWCGGGVYLDSGAMLYMHGGSIRQNTAAHELGDWLVPSSYYDGGGVYADTDSRVYMSGGSIVANEGYDGGGICSNKADIFLYGGSVVHNVSYNRGGGVYQYGSNHGLTIDGGTVSNNIAETRGKMLGGGVYVSKSTFTLSSGTVSDNAAGQDGGGVYSDNTDPAQTVFSGGTVSGNTAEAESGRGGGLCVRALTMSGGTISGNTAAEGAGIAGDDSGNSSAGAAIYLNGGAITGNTAASTGSAVSAGNQLYLRQISITGNTCKTRANTTGLTSQAPCAVRATEPYIDATGLVEIVDNEGGDLARNHLAQSWAGTDESKAVSILNIRSDTRIGLTFATSEGTIGDTIVHFSSESQADAAMGCFYSASSSYYLVRGHNGAVNEDEGHLLVLYPNSKLEDYRVPAVEITKVTVSDGASIGAITLEQDFVDVNNKAWVIPASAGFTKGQNLTVTVEYQVERAVDGSSQTETKTQVFTDQDLSTVKTFTVREYAEGTTQHSGVSTCQLLVEYPADQVTASVSVREYAADGTYSDIAITRAVGGSITLETAATLNGAAFAEWIQSTDGGTTWTSAKAKGYSVSGGVATDVVTVPTVAQDATVLLRPAYSVGNITLSLAAPTAGEALPTTATWTANNDLSGTATLTWTPSDATAQSGTEYTATAAIQLSDDQSTVYEIDKASLVLADSSAEATVAVKYRAFNLMRATVTFSAAPEGQIVLDTLTVGGLTAPVAGEALAATAAVTGAQGGTQQWSASDVAVSWAPDDSETTAAYDTAYTATVLVDVGDGDGTAAGSVVLADDLSVAADGFEPNAISVRRTSDTTATITVQFASTATDTVTAVAAPAATVAQGTSFADATAALGDAVQATLASGGTLQLEPTWQDAGYGASAAGTCTLTGTVAVPAGYDVASDLAGAYDSSTRTLQVGAEVTVVAATTVTGVDALDALQVPWGTALADMDFPRTVGITLSDGASSTASIVWDESSVSPAYDPSSTSAQTFTVTGKLTFPVGTTDPSGTRSSVTLTVNVAAAEGSMYTVYYGLQSLDGESYVWDDYLEREEVSAAVGTEIDADSFVDIDGFGYPAKITYAYGTGAEQQEPLVVTADGSLVVRLYYNRETYDLDFDTNGGTAVASQEVAFGATPAAVEAPTRDGFVFAGWYDNADLDGTAVSLSGYAMPAEHVTLYAKWVEAGEGTAYLNFWGGSLRMGKYATSAGATDYTKADLRFGFNFVVPAEATGVKFGWYYGATEAQVTDESTRLTKEGTASRAAGSLATDPQGVSGTVANLVITGIDAAHYSSSVYVQMYVTYTDANGDEHTVTSSVVSRSVAQVAASIAAAGSGAGDAERAYANGILNAMPATESTDDSATEAADETATGSAADAAPAE